MAVSPAPAQRPPARSPARDGFTPLVTGLLIAVNLGIWGWMVSTGIDVMMPSASALLDGGANSAFRTLHGEWWRLITSMFLHGGALHVGLNMIVLWDLGRITERHFGSLGFLIVYLVAGIGGSVASVAWNAGSLTHVSVGASGAVFGVAGAFLAFLLRNRSRIDPELASGLRTSLLMFVGLNLAIGYAVPLIDQAAHVGGLVTGFVGGFLASPLVERDGLERAYLMYPVVALLGVALCAIVAFGLVS